MTAAAGSLTIGRMWLLYVRNRSDVCRGLGSGLLSAVDLRILLASASKVT